MKVEVFAVTTVSDDFVGARITKALAVDLCVENGPGGYRIVRCRFSGPPREVVAAAMDRPDDGCPEVCRVEVLANGDAEVKETVTRTVRRSEAK